MTGNDADYTGTQVATIEQGMRVTMSDSLRLVLRDLLHDLDDAAALHGG